LFRLKHGIQNTGKFCIFWIVLMWKLECNNGIGFILILLFIMAEWLFIICDVPRDLEYKVK